MKNYRFDVNKMIRWLMPFFLVKPLHLAWLQTLLSPVTTAYADFLVYRQLQLRNATINSEANRLTRALRDEFNDETIYLLHLTDYLDTAYIYLESEGAFPEFDYLDAEHHEPVDYDFTDAEYNSQYDFTIRVPVSLSGSQLEIYAFAKKYVFSGINYNIETF